MRNPLSRIVLGKLEPMKPKEPAGNVAIRDNRVLHVVADNGILRVTQRLVAETPAGMWPLIAEALKAELVIEEYHPCECYATKSTD